MVGVQGGEHVPGTAILPDTDTSVHLWITVDEDGSLQLELIDPAMAADAIAADIAGSYFMG